MRCLPTILRPLSHACLLPWQRCRLRACPPSGSVIRCGRLCRKASRGHSGRDPFLQEPSCARPLGHRALVPHGPLTPPEAVGAVGQKHSPQERPVGRTPPEPWSTPARWGNGGRVCPRRGTRRGRSRCSLVAERRLAETPLSADAHPPPRSAGPVAALSAPEGAQEERCDDSIMN